MKKSVVQHLFSTQSIRSIFLVAFSSLLPLCLPSPDCAFGRPTPPVEILMAPGVDTSGSNTDAVEVDSPRLEITHAHFICDKMDCGHYHEHCALEVFYSLEALQTARGPIKPEVRCKARVCYHTAGGDTLFSEANSDLNESDKPNYMAEDNSVSIDFHFSFYEAVVKAQIDHIECRIHRPEKSRVPDKRYHSANFSNTSVTVNQSGG